MLCMYFRCHDVTETCHRFLDLTGPFQLGGLSSGHDSASRNRAVRTSGFVGCIRDLYVDERLIDLASYVWNNGTVEGCAAKANFCQSSPCQNSGFAAFHMNKLPITAEFLVKYCYIAVCAFPGTEMVWVTVYEDSSDSLKFKGTSCCLKLHVGCKNLCYRQNPAGWHRLTCVIVIKWLYCIMCCIVYMLLRLKLIHFC